jgi:hypothetical protein
MYRLGVSRDCSAGLWYQSSGVRIRPNPSHFSGQKPSGRIPSGGGEKLSVNGADLRHVKDPYNGLEVATVSKITGYLSPTNLLATARCLSRYLWS